jgi:hypothetical protein
MDNYQHHVSGFFTHREDAENAYSRLTEQGLPRSRLYIFDKDTAAPAPSTNAKSKEVRNDVLVDGAIGTAVGTGIGALGEVALIAANVSLFVASPLLAPLMMMGWGASIGGLIGVAAGASDKTGFADLIRDAVSNGQIVLVAKTLTTQESEIARDVIKESVGDYNDVSTV